MSLMILLGVASLTSVKSQNWPGWRGPNGDGTSAETSLPVKWDSVTNVIWKTPVPGVGYSSPVVWKDRIFTCSALPATQEKVLLCFKSADGALLWQRTVLKGSFEGKHNDNSHASGTPATDGTMIFVSFLDGADVVVAAYDFSGKQLWLVRPGSFSSPHGYSCSPVIYKDKVIINGASMGASFVAALGKADGRTIWKVSHENPAHSFSTPIIRNIGGKTQMIYCANKEIASYNPEDGKKIWFVPGPSEDFCSTPVYSEKSGLVLVSSAWPNRILMAIRPDGQGDVSKTHVAWQTRKGAYYVPSPVITSDYLFSTMTTGDVHCIDIATGNTLWIERMGKQYASPVLAGGLVYMPNDEGVITVLQPGQSFSPVSRNHLGEKMFASPAISNGKIYLRGLKNLYCIGSAGSK
ncbi:MAG: PQQ-like beta-propeller repeat protein [Bacteroidales bacterium]|nr:PQQ-like beta-propeller repeat protein [Bacteroidales bacterium]